MLCPDSQSRMRCAPRSSNLSLSRFSITKFLIPPCVARSYLVSMAVSNNTKTCVTWSSWCSASALSSASDFRLFTGSGNNWLKGRSMAEITARSNSPRFSFNSGVVQQRATNTLRANMGFCEKSRSHNSSTLDNSMSLKNGLRPV